MRESNVFKGSPLKKEFKDDFIITDSSFLKGHNRSLTPNSGMFVHSHRNSDNIHQNPMAESTIIGSMRSSINFNQNVKENSPHILKNIELLECQKYNDLLTPSTSKMTSHPKQIETPQRKKGAFKSFSENKAGLISNKYPNSGDYSYLDNMRKSCQNNNSDLKTRKLNKSST